jgi:hypothetical protein
MEGKSVLKLISLLILIVLIIPISYGFYLGYRAQNLCDDIKIGSIIEIDKLKDTSTVEFNRLKELSKSYGSNSYGIISNYVLLNFNFIYLGYRCVLKIENNIVSDKKICNFEDDDQCFDLNL